MKKISLSLFILFILSNLNAQNEIKIDEKYEKSCNGVCLFQKEFSNDSSEQEFVLLKKKTAKLYLFKEGGKGFPSIDIYDFNGNHITNFTSYYFEDKNYMLIKYKSNYNKPFTVKLRFPKNETSKATVVLCYKSPLIISPRNQPDANKQTGIN